MSVDELNGNGERNNVPPFPPEYRASGLLLHVTSLPSPYGIGDLGPAAFEWVNRLQNAGQTLVAGAAARSHRLWKLTLSILSSFAGNALLISPDGLVADGLLRPSDAVSQFASNQVDYDAVIPFKYRLLEKAWTNFKAGAGRVWTATTTSAGNRQTGSKTTLFSEP